MKVFVSYTSSDRHWAHWIGWQLQQAGHFPFVHEWEVGAGENIAGWMEKRAKEADRLIGVFSDAYSTAAYSQSERWAAYWQDPRGQKGFLIPIEVRKVSEWPAFVRPLKRLSLVDLEESEASKRLIAFLEPPAAPLEKPIFPGSGPTTSSTMASFTEGGEKLDALPPSFPASPPNAKKPQDERLSVSLPTADPEVNIRCINDYEPKPIIFGREDEVETVVGALLEGRAAVIAGGPGMGKTAVATVALYDPRVVARFGRRRVFASLETATEPRAILAKLVETLGLSPTGDDVTLLRVLETSAAELPFAAILDNVETVFDADRAGAERLLSLVTHIKGLSLVATIRGVAPPIPSTVSIDNLPKLATDPARDAFLAVAGSSFKADPDLPHLLEALDGHALSIRLVAAQAIGSPSLKGLRESWDEAHAEILRMSGEKEGRLTSVRASLALSLNSRRMKSLPLGRRLMALLAYLPGGLAEGDVRSLLGERGVMTSAKANEAVTCLHQLRLVERRPDLRLRMLTPIRECVKRDVPLYEGDRRRLIDRYLMLTVRAGTIGKRDWERLSEEVEAEADNLDTICELSLATKNIHKLLEEALLGLAKFHSFSGRGTAGSVARAAELFRFRSPQMSTVCIWGLAEIAKAHSDYDAAHARFQEALALFRRLGNTAGEANCIKCLSEIAHMRSSRKKGLELLQMALALYRKIGGGMGEANCIHSLGDIARSNSDHEAASGYFQDALILYRRIDEILGEANCIAGLGHIALARCDFEAATSNYQKALLLYKRMGAVLGEAHCVGGFGNVARMQADYDSACIFYSEAQVLYRRIGSVICEANCSRWVGAVAHARRDHEVARQCYSGALALYRRSEDALGEAETLIRQGLLHKSNGNPTQALADIEAGFLIYFRIVDSEDRALVGWQALRRAFISCDSTGTEHWDTAKNAWITVGRFDLINEWIDQKF